MRSIYNLYRYATAAKGVAFKFSPGQGEYVLLLHGVVRICACCSKTVFRNFFNQKTFQWGVLFRFLTKL